MGRMTLALCRRLILSWRSRLALASSPAFDAFPDFAWGAQKYGSSPLHGQADPRKILKDLPQCPSLSSPHKST